MDRDRCDLPVSTAIAILVLVTAAALAAVAVAVAVAGWLTGLLAVATGLGAWSAFALIFGAGLHITYRKPDTSIRDFARPGAQPVSDDGWLAGVGPGRASSQDHTAIAARPWPSAETPTVHADRPDCAH